MDIAETTQKIEVRLASLERKLLSLETRMKTVSEEQFLANEVLQEFAFARLYKTAQDANELASLIIVLEKHPPPPTTNERIALLHTLALISSDLASHLTNIYTFLNVLMQSHDESYLPQLYSFTTQEITHLATFHTLVCQHVEAKGLR